MSRPTSISLAQLNDAVKAGVELAELTEREARETTGGIIPDPTTMGYVGEPPVSTF